MTPAQKHHKAVAARAAAAATRAAPARAPSPAVVVGSPSRSDTRPGMSAPPGPPPCETQPRAEAPVISSDTE